MARVNVPLLCLNSCKNQIRIFALEIDIFLFAIICLLKWTDHFKSMLFYFFIILLIKILI